MITPISHCCHFCQLQLLISVLIRFSDFRLIEGKKQTKHNPLFTFVILGRKVNPKKSKLIQACSAAVYRGVWFAYNLSAARTQTKPHGQLSAGAVVSTLATPRFLLLESFPSALMLILENLFHANHTQFPLPDAALPRMKELFYL